MSGYAQKLLVVDMLIENILLVMAPEDVLVIQVDHGNDPTIGHPHHTREYVPLLIYHSKAASAYIGTRSTLADVGATVSNYFDCQSPESGTSFLSYIMKKM